MCSTCGACASVCPKDAISYETTTAGRIYASVNDGCIDCSLCSKVCPSEHIEEQQMQGKYNEGHVDAVYVGHSTNSTYYENAQSGGVCATLVDYLLTLGKIDAAVMVRMSYGNTPKVEVEVVDTTEKLTQFQKSCYSPVPLLSALKRCKDKKSVAVVGLPCQMAAIMAMQAMKKYSNVKYKIGLVCEGVMGATAQDVLISYADNNTGKNRKIDWKRKSVPATSGGGYLSAPIVVYDELGHEHIMPNSYRFALKDIFTNPRCKVCNDKLNVNADIVLGDPWGMSGVDWVNGDSLIITRTPIGKQLFEELTAQNLVTVSQHDISEVINGQHVAARNENVKKELHSHEYLNTYRQIENLSKEDIIVKARLQISQKMRRKRIAQFIPYRIYRKIITLLKHLR